MLKAGVWYVVGRRGRGARTYKLSTCTTCSCPASTFKRPRRFDLVAYWADATQRFEESVYRDLATLRASAAGLKRGCAASARSCAGGADRTAGLADARGWVR